MWRIDQHYYSNPNDKFSDQPILGLSSDADTVATGLENETLKTDLGTDDDGGADASLYARLQQKQNAVNIATGNLKTWTINGEGNDEHNIIWCFS